MGAQHRSGSDTTPQSPDSYGPIEHNIPADFWFEILKIKTYLVPSLTNIFRGLNIIVSPRQRETLPLSPSQQL